MQLGNIFPRFYLRFGESMPRQVLSNQRVVYKILFGLNCNLVEICANVLIFVYILLFAFACNHIEFSHLVAMAIAFCFCG
jgi:hypothetical protein